MGVIKFFSDDYCNGLNSNNGSVSNNMNPDPSNYRIVRYCEYHLEPSWLVVEIEYPDCKNYSGRKILVYKDITIHQLREQELIDPHFLENTNHISPLARFEPTTAGFQYAVDFCFKCL